MKWFSGRRSQPPGGPRQEAPAEETRQPSPALNALWRRLRTGRNYNVLDLGPASGANVEFFSQFSGKIYIENLQQTLASFDYLSPEDGVSLDSVFRYLLPYKRNTRFDVIFSWDLFNYLESREFLHLIRHLNRYCDDGAIIFALISTKKSIPEQPPRYRIVDQETIASTSATTIMKACPRYEETELLRLMPSFRVGHSFLMRSGFKEYLFLRDRSVGYRTPVQL